MLGWVNSESWIWACVEAELVNLPTLPSLLPPGPTLLLCPDKRPALLRTHSQQAHPCPTAGPARLCCPGEVRQENSVLLSSAASDGRGHFRAPQLARRGASSIPKPHRPCTNAPRTSSSMLPKQKGRARSPEYGGL